MLSTPPILPMPVGIGREIGLLLQLPVAVSVPAGRGVGLLHLAVDQGLDLGLAADPTGVWIGIGGLGHDRVPVARIRVDPG